MLFMLKYFQFNGFLSPNSNDIRKFNDIKQQLSKILITNLETKQKNKLKKQLKEFKIDSKNNQEFTTLKKDIFANNCNEAVHNIKLAKLETIFLTSNENKMVDNVFSKGSSVGGLQEFLFTQENINNTNKIILPVFKTPKYVCSANIYGCYAHVRNQTAHLHQFNNRDVSIIELMNKMRTLLSYDRKRKNAVMKSIIDLLDEKNIVLTMKKQGDNFVIDTIVSKKIVHLKKEKEDKQILEDYYNEDFIIMVRQILEYKE